MAINKVLYGSEVLIDISDSTVDESTLRLGVVAYKKNGDRIVGSYVPEISGGSNTEYEYKTVSGTNANALRITGLTKEPSSVYISIANQLNASASYVVTSALVSPQTKKAVTSRQQNNKQWGVSYVSTPSMTYSNGILTVSSGNDSYLFGNVSYGVILVYDSVSDGAMGGTIDSARIDAIYA